MGAGSLGEGPMLLLFHREGLTFFLQLPLFLFPDITLNACHPDLISRRKL